MTVASLGRGIYIPIPTFFNQDEELDLVALDQHIAYLSKTGISGLVVLGSMGEGVALTEQERFKVIEQSAKSVSKHNPDLKIIAGTSAQSAKATLHLTEMAAKAGAHFCLVLPPSYYKTAIDDVGIEKFYRQIADTSPLPLVIYNYPGVSQGVDVGVKLVVKLSKHPNIVGLKATDGSVGKMSDLVRKTDPKEITLLAGSAEFFLPELMMGAAGLVPGSGNIFPRVCVEIQRLYESNQLQKAIDLQHQLVEPDQALLRWKGIPGIKSYIHRRLGYGNGICRTPLYKQEDIATIESAADKMWETEQALTK